MFLMFVIKNVVNSTELLYKTKPTNCSFSETVDKCLRVDCSNSGLQTLPVIPGNVCIADFQNNNISYIKKQYFSNYSDITELDLSINKLVALDRETFEGLTALILLRLNSNQIRQLASDTFENITSMVQLYIQNNHINWSSTKVTFPSSMKSLHADAFVYKSSVFKTAINRLRELTSSGFEGQCNMSIVTRDTFKKVPNLQVLEITQCGINYIFRHSLDFLKNLYRLDISYNPCLKFAGLQNVTMDLPSTSIRYLSFNKIHQTFEMNTMLLKSHIADLHNTKLVELHGDSNRIQLIETGALKLLPLTMQNLSFSDNMFSYGNYLNDAIVITIKFLNASYMFTAHKRQPDEKCIKNSLYTHDNRPQSNAMTDNQSKRNTMTEFHSTMPLPLQLKTIIYKQCKLRFEIPYIDVTENSLEYLDVSYNTFYSWIGPINKTNKLSYLVLSNNLCSNVSKIFFMGAPNLETLKIQNNYLGLSFSSDTKGEIFQYSTKLKILDASGNRITFLPFHFFKNQIHLENLSLAENMLDDVTFQVEHMKNLSNLDLSGNIIFELSESARNFFI